MRLAFGARASSRRRTAVAAAEVDELTASSWKTTMYGRVDSSAITKPAGADTASSNRARNVNRRVARRVGRAAPLPLRCIDPDARQGGALQIAVGGTGDGQDHGLRGPSSVFC